MTMLIIFFFNNRRRIFSSLNAFQTLSLKFMKLSIGFSDLIKGFNNLGTQRVLHRRYRKSSAFLIAKCSFFVYGIFNERPLNQKVFIFKIFRNRFFIRRALAISGFDID